MYYVFGFAAMRAKLTGRSSPDARAAASRNLNINDCADAFAFGFCGGSLLRLTSSQLQANANASISPVSNVLKYSTSLWDRCAPEGC